MFLDFDNATLPKISSPCVAAPSGRRPVPRSGPARVSGRNVLADGDFHALVASVLDEDDDAATWFDDDRCESVAPSTALGVSEVRFETVRSDLEDANY